MKKSLFLAFASLITLRAFEPAQLSLANVSHFEAGDSAFSIRHRFFGDITKSEDFFGMDDGANIMLSLRHAFSESFSAEIQRTRDNAQYSLIGSYNAKFSFIETALELHYYSMEESLLNSRQTSYFANGIAQTPLIVQWLRLSVNIGYDDYYKRAGAGFATELQFDNFFDEAMPFTQHISLITEFYTKYGGLRGFEGRHHAYAAGIKFETFAHHFELLATNATALEPRVMMQGAEDNVVHFGFNITRKF